MHLTVNVDELLRNEPGDPLLKWMQIAHREVLERQAAVQGLVVGLILIPSQRLSGVPFKRSRDGRGKPTTPTNEST
jgi:hypothetical protein